MQASPSALNTPQRTSFDVPTPLKIKKAPILGARKKLTQKKYHPDPIHVQHLDPQIFSGEAFFQSSKIEDLFIFIVV